MMVSAIHKRDVTVMKLRGILDHRMAADLEAKMFDLVSRGSLKYVFDFKHVKGILSRGVHALTDIKAHVERAGGSVKLAELSREVRLVMEFARITELFEVFPDQTEALKSYGVHPKAAPGAASS